MGSSRFHPPSKAGQGHSPSLSPTFTTRPTDEAGCRDGRLFLWKGETEGGELSTQAGRRTGGTGRVSSLTNLGGFPLGPSLKQASQFTTPENRPAETQTQKGSRIVFPTIHFQVCC